MRTPRGRSAAGNLVSLDQNALILFTSAPPATEGVVHTHRSLRARWMALRQSLGSPPSAARSGCCRTHFVHGSSQLALSGLSDSTCSSSHRSRRIWSCISARCSIPRDHVPVRRYRPSGGLPQTANPHAPPRSSALLRLGAALGHLWEEIRRWTGAREVWNSYGITETGSWLARHVGDRLHSEDGLIASRGWGDQILRGTDAPRSSMPRTSVRPVRAAMSGQHPRR